MTNTLDWVMQNWNWATTWGWDYGMIAMTAARLGKPDTALKALLIDTQKNTWLKNGHNFQTKARLRVYLPGNGALLKAARNRSTQVSRKTGNGTFDGRDYDVCNKSNQKAKTI